MGFNERDVTEILDNLSSEANADIMVATQQFANSRNREQVYESVCRLLKPESVEMGGKITRVRGKLKTAKFYGYYIPLGRQ